MMKKVILVVALLILITGCKEEKPVVEGPFVGGSSGVDIDFVEGSPISEFSVDDTVPVKVRVMNNGEYDLASDTVMVRLYGLPMQDYSLSSDYKTVSGELRGVRKGLIEEGGEQIMEMGNLKYSRSVAGFLEAELFTKVCYPYQTEGRITACASSRSIKEADGEQICTVDGEKAQEGFVSSAPVQITSFTEDLRGTSQVMFRINIANQGVGDVYALDSNCIDLDDAVKRADKINRVKVRVLPEDVVCTFLGQDSNEGEIRLDAGQKTLVCTMDVEDTGASYKRAIEIYLDYKYVGTNSKLLKILEA